MLSLSLKLYYQNKQTNKQTNNDYRIYNSYIIGKMGPQNSKNANRVWLPAYTALVDT